MNTPLLVVDNLRVCYGSARVVFGVSFQAWPGSVVAVLGANGAGKSTLARSISGLVPGEGSIRFDGHDINGWPPHRIRRAGLVHLPESRGILPGLSVQENLLVATMSTARSHQHAAVEQAYEQFPALAERRKQRAGTLSGGEQQMLALACALAVRPRLLIADELSLGLAPLIVDAVFERLEIAVAAGVTVVVIEQFMHRALTLADTCVILRQGTVAWSGAADDAHDEVLERYLGHDEPQARAGTARA